jgi:hypothetical protein
MRFLGSLVPPTVWEMLEGAERLGELKEVKGGQAGRASIGALAAVLAIALSGCAAATLYVQQHSAGLAATALVAGTARRSAARSSRPTSSPARRATYRERGETLMAQIDYSFRGLVTGAYAASSAPAASAPAAGYGLAKIYASAAAANPAPIKVGDGRAEVKPVLVDGEPVMDPVMQDAGGAAAAKAVARLGRRRRAGELLCRAQKPSPIDV